MPPVPSASEQRAGRGGEAARGGGAQRGLRLVLGSVPFPGFTSSRGLAAFRKLGLKSISVCLELTRALLKAKAQLFAEASHYFLPPSLLDSQEQGLPMT